MHIFIPCASRSLLITGRATTFSTPSTKNYSLKFIAKFRALASTSIF